MLNIALENMLPLHLEDTGNRGYSNHPDWFYLKNAESVGKLYDDYESDEIFLDVKSIEDGIHTGKLDCFDKDVTLLTKSGISRLCYSNSEADIEEVKQTLGI